MTDKSKKNISISSGDVVVAEDKPVLIDEDKVPPQDELPEISVADFSFPETDENTTLAGDLEMSTTLEWYTESEEDDVDEDKGPHSDELHEVISLSDTIVLESDTLAATDDDNSFTPQLDTESEEDDVEEDKGPHKDELHEEISLSDVIFLESDENTMTARDVDNSFTLELDTESEEDVLEEDEAPQQDELEERMEVGKAQMISDIFCPGEDENTMPLTNVDRNMTNEREPEADEVYDSDSESEYAKKGVDVKKNISGGQVSQDISVGVALVDEAKPVLADEDICGGDVKKNISGGEVSQDISAGVALVDEDKPVLADNDMPLIRSYSTGIVAVIFVITYKCFLFQHRMSL